MNRDIELDGWRRQWQAATEAPRAADLRDKVARETRLRKIGMIAPTLVTIVIGGGIAMRAATSAHPEDAVLAAGVWAFIAVTWAGTLWIDRGNWRPLGQTTADFVALSIHRCQSTIAALRFGAFLYVAELVFIFFWQLHSLAIAWTTLAASWPVVLLGWLGAPVFFGFLFWLTRRKRTELAYLLELQRQLTDES